MRVASVSHAVFAAIMIAIGVVGLIKGDFTPVWDPIPQDSHALAYLCSFISLTTGIGLLWQRTAAAAARGLFASLLLWLLLLRVPSIVLSPTFGVFWPGFEIAEMVAGSWILYAWFAADWDSRRFGFATGKKGLRLARVLYGAALIFFGFAHFFDLKDTVSLVPGWLPWHVAWAYFTGGAFVVAGFGAHRRVCTAGSRTLGVADGYVHATGVGTYRSGRLPGRLPMERDFRLCGAHG